MNRWARSVSVMGLVLAVMGSQVGLFAQTDGRVTGYNPLDKPGAKPGLPIWMDNKIGDKALEPNYVPAGWSALSVEKHKVSTEGRHYVFGGAGLPAEAVVDGVPMISGPVELVGSVDGNAIVWKPGTLTVTPRGKGLVEINGKAESDKLTVEVRTWLEYDFMARHRITVTPKGKVRVDSLDLKFKMPAEMLEMTQYHVENGPKAMSGIDQQRKMVNLLLKENNIQTPYCPSMWVGNVDRGIGFYVEQVRYWNPGKEKPFVTLGKQAGGVVMHLVGTPTTVDQLQVYEVMTLLTPARKMPESWRAWNFSSRGGFSSKAPTDGTNMSIYWDSVWALSTWSFFDGIRDPEGLLRQIAIDRKAGIGILAYVDAQMMTYGQHVEHNGKTYYYEDPELKKYAMKWKSTDSHRKTGEPEAGAIPVKNLEEWFRTFGNERVTAKLSNAVVPTINPEASDMVVYWVDYFAEKFAIYGTYFDDVLIRSDYTETGPMGRQSYVTRDGETHGTTQFREMRARMKRVNYVTNGVPGRSSPNLAHCSGVFPMVFLNYFDILLTGENTYYWYREPEVRDLSVDGDYYYAHIWGHIDNLKPELFNRHWGTVVLFLPELRYSTGKKIPKPTKGTRTMMSYLLHMDVLVWPTWCDADVIYEWWKIKDGFDMKDTQGEKVSFTPYWENGLVKSQNRAAVVSYFRKGPAAEKGSDSGKFLVVVSNHSFGPSWIDLELPGGWATRSVTDARTGESIAVPAGGRIGMSLPPYEYAVIKVEGGK